MNRPRLALVIILICALAPLACSKPPPKPKGIGKLLVASSARNLSLAPDGKTLVFVGEVAPPAEKDTPEGVFQGVVTTVPVAGGVPRQLGGGVTTLEDGYRISSDGRWVAYLQAFRFRDQAGSLNVAPLPLGDARQVASDATYYKFSPDGKTLGFVAAGEMHLYSLESNADRLVVKNAATFEFAKDSRHVMVRRPVAFGGDLLLAEVQGSAEPSKLGTNVGDYDFSPDGARLAFNARVGGPNQPYTLFGAAVGGKLEKLGEGVSTFLFSPDGQWIAFVDGLGVKRSLGNLQIAPTAGGPAKKLGENVVEHRWAPDSKAIAFRETNEDKSGRSWNSFKVATMPTGAIRFKDDGVPNFVWSFDGSHIAFLKRIAKPVYSVDLFLMPIAGEQNPRLVDRGVFGYQFAPGDRELWYRTQCVRSGRECDLMAASVADAAVLPRRLVQGIWNFRPTANGERLLLTYPRLDTEAAADLGFLDVNAKQPSKGIDQYVLPGAQFVDEAGGVVVYIVGERKREGVYVAELKADPVRVPPK